MEAGVVTPGLPRPDGAQDASRFPLAEKVYREAAYPLLVLVASELFQDREDTHIGYPHAHTSCMVVVDRILPEKSKRLEKNY